MADLKSTTINGDLNVNGAVRGSIYSAISDAYPQTLVPLSPIVYVLLHISSLPTTIYDEQTRYIDENYYVLRWSVDLDDMGSNWTVYTGETASGQSGYGIRITGTLNNSTWLGLWLAKITNFSTYSLP